MIIKFEKMEGLGNDFILLDDRKGIIAQGNRAEGARAYSELSKKLCSRNFGIGADGIILLLNSDTEDIGFRIFNSDGSEAQMCGNGMRCFARNLFENRVVNKDKFSVETLAGRVIPEVLFNDEGGVKSIRVDMGEPVLDPMKIPFDIQGRHLNSGEDMVAVNTPLSINGLNFNLTAVSMGNPHAVIFVDNVKKAEVEKLGKQIENHPWFPEKTNVEFIEMVDSTQMKMRVWERGAGETLACGTGACAALVAANLNGKSEREATIHLKGGALDIEWRASDNHIYKTGPANSIFKGDIEL